MQEQTKMKSLNSTTRCTEASTPYLQSISTDEYSCTAIPALRHTNTKMFEYINSTMEKTQCVQRNTSLSKPTRPRISIIPLTREKVMVGQRGWKRGVERGTFDGVMSTRLTPVGKESSDEGGSSKHKEFFTMMSFMYNKTKRGNYKLEVLLDELVAFFGRKKQREYLAQVDEIAQMAVPLRAGLFQDCGILSYELIKGCRTELAKLFFNVCFEIYLYKKNQFGLLELGIVHRDIEYYSRRLGMLRLTLVTCLDLGRVLLDFFEFEKAEEQFSRAVKLAVFVGDKYREELAIDRLGMCQYYRGDMMGAHFYHSSVDRLSSYNKLRILEHYSNEREIQKLLEAKTKEKSQEQAVKQDFFRHSKENVEFTFDQRCKDTEFAQNNYNSFKCGLKSMIKINHLRKKMPFIKSAMDKTRRIGEKKYNGKDYLLPKASKFYQRSGDRSKDEMLQSHKSYNRSNVNYQCLKIDKLCKILDQILNFFVCDSKVAAKTIREERESMASEEN